MCEPPNACNVEGGGWPIGLGPSDMFCICPVGGVGIMPPISPCVGGHCGNVVTWRGKRGESRGWKEKESKGREVERRRVGRRKRGGEGREESERGG